MLSPMPNHEEEATAYTSLLWHREESAGQVAAKSQNLLSPYLQPHSGLQPEKIDNHCLTLWNWKGLVLGLPLSEELTI